MGVSTDVELDHLLARQHELREYTSEDPCALLHGGTYFMTYTANGYPKLAKHFC